VSQQVARRRSRAVLVRQYSSPIALHFLSSP
jgi:hypothetical protein